MSKILFGANDGNSVFTAHDTIRAKVSSEPEQAGEDLNNKIDWLIDKIDGQDPTRAEMLRACPTVKIMDGESIVTTIDNPIYEHYPGLDIGTVADAPVERQKSDKPSKQTKTSTKTSTKKTASKGKSKQTSQSKSTGKTSKKDQARDIYKRLAGERRKDVIDAMQSELGFSKAHASTYYQAIKKEQ